MLTSGNVVVLLAMAQLASAQLMNMGLFPPFPPSAHRMLHAQAMNPFAMQSLHHHSLLADRLMGLDQMLGIHHRDPIRGGRLTDGLRNRERSMLDQFRALDSLPYSPWADMTRRRAQRDKVFLPPSTPVLPKEWEPDTVLHRRSPVAKRPPASPPNAAAAEMDRRTSEQEFPMNEEMRFTNRPEAVHPPQQQQRKPEAQAHQADTHTINESMQEQSGNHDSKQSKSQRRAEKKAFYRKQKMEADRVERERAERERLKRESMEKEYEDFIQVVDISEHENDANTPKHINQVAEPGEEILEL